MADRQEILEVTPIERVDETAHQLGTILRHEWPDYRP
jgi:hypothetical protein